ncbi:MAG: DUF1854 domain-containing protein [Planctomycetota bacterium]|jgi:hypothetical protein|nr:DUF1854 domain-containing protein [Planctomycetota bacterium]
MLPGEDAGAAGGNPDPGPAAGIGRLWRERGKIMYRDAAGGEPAAVWLRWARPLSDPGGPLSVLLAGKKTEAAYIPDLASLDGDSRRVAEEELSQAMILPRVTCIRKVVSRFGNYYWQVETDRGERKFLLSSPESNCFFPRPDAVVIRDVFDNCYEISPLSGLDAASRREMDKVL